jgi:hypothetical protein
MSVGVRVTLIEHGGTNTNGLIALGCGGGGGHSLIINDSGATILPVPLPAGTDETWYDPVSNHFFFAQSGGAAGGWLGVVNANEYPAELRARG